MNKEILTEQEKLFMYLLGTFQSSAWISLGKTENPMTGKKDTNIEQAAFYINLLDMLQEKTKQIKMINNRNTETQETQKT